MHLSTSVHVFVYNSRDPALNKGKRKSVFIGCLLFARKLVITKFLNTGILLAKGVHVN